MDEEERYGKKRRNGRKRKERERDVRGGMEGVQRVHREREEETSEG